MRPRPPAAGHGRTAGVLVVAALLAVPVVATAINPWRWKSPQSQPRGPAVDPRAATRTPASIDNRAGPVVLQVQDRGSHYEVQARNPAPGPVQVQLSLRGGASNARAVPALPVRALVAAGRDAVVARIYPLDPRLATGFEVDLEQVPGDPAARPFDFHYQLPFTAAPVRVHQGFGGRFSHDDAANRYAVDFALAEGTPVLAARGGVVLQVETGFAGAGLDREHDGTRANTLRILHDDGSMALYAHLQPGSAQVRAGDLVQPGQVLARAGSTGFSTAPHLHFVVQVNGGMQLRAIPFRMFATAGELKFAREAAVAEP
jgi:murein DD-endopeptidase MepM/ murein hydrolase activator NlpD